MLQIFQENIFCDYIANISSSSFYFTSINVKSITQYSLMNFTTVVLYNNKMNYTYHFLLQELNSIICSFVLLLTEEPKFKCSFALVII